MVAKRNDWRSEELPPEAEAFAARLARTAYEIALSHAGRGVAFTDLELGLWHELREVVKSREDALSRGAA